VSGHVRTSIGGAGDLREEGGDNACPRSKHGRKENYFNDSEQLEVGPALFLDKYEGRDYG
jgi:hypothetical protein